MAKVDYLNEWHIILYQKNEWHIIKPCYNFIIISLTYGFSK